jgi:hypothetical protein
MAETLHFQKERFKTAMLFHQGKYFSGDAEWQIL